MIGYKALLNPSQNERKESRTKTPQSKGAKKSIVPICRMAFFKTYLSATPVVMLKAVSYQFSSVF